MSATAMTAPKRKSKTTRKQEKTPEYLIRETIDGISFYDRGFREVLDGNKTCE